MNRMSWPRVRTCCGECGGRGWVDKLVISTQVQWILIVAVVAIIALFASARWLQ